MPLDPRVGTIFCFTFSFPPTDPHLLLNKMCIIDFSIYSQVINQILTAGFTLTDLF